MIAYIAEFVGTFVLVCGEYGCATPAVDNIGQLWLFIVAPLIVAAIAAGLYRVLRAVDPVIQIPASQAHAALSGQQEAGIEVAKVLADTGFPKP